MNGYQKERAMAWLAGLSETHGRIREAARRGDAWEARVLLLGCQEGAISIGSRIGETEGEGFSTVALLEEYCEAAYRAYAALKGAGDGEDLAGVTSEGAGGGKEPALGNGDGTLDGAESACLEMDAASEAALRSLQRDVPERREVLFLPYKASMWDTLESIWMAARADPSCEAVVVPIPYYDKNADGSFGEEHYDGEILPEYVPVAHYGEYSIERRRPDVVYIHNPYDDTNRVTSVAPQYYSFELKKYARRLVYVPYYAATGGTGEGQAFCKAHIYADFIIAQSERDRRCYSAALPREKILVLGSPALDRVVRLCGNPPEPPVEWRDRLFRPDGGRKRVYFFNTSIVGMLPDTRQFLLKMEYVFRAFRGREDCCLLWRPHPLLESTFDSLRPSFKPFYMLLKDAFLKEGIGIYDETADVEATISLCDAYIGDAVSGVVAFFGVAGKPIFLLNDYICSPPGEDDWRGEMLSAGFFPDGGDDWIVTSGNQLYHAPNHDYRYEFYCDLSEWSSGSYYLRAIEVGGKVYVCPANAQDVLVISDRGIQKRISLAHRTERIGAFCGAWEAGGFLFLIPAAYPALVRIDTRTDEAAYFEWCRDFIVGDVRGERVAGGSCAFGGRLLLSSPSDGRVLSVDPATGEAEEAAVREEGDGGCLALSVAGDFVYSLPREGNVVVRWNPATGEREQIAVSAPGFRCVPLLPGHGDAERPFSSVAESGGRLFFAPAWGDRFLCLDKGTGRAEEWKPPFEMAMEDGGCHASRIRGAFLRRTDSLGEWTWRFFSCMDRRLYDVNLETGDFREIPVYFSKEEVEAHAPGFSRCSEWQPYACEEGALFSLEDFLDGGGAGRPFDREAQLEAYGEVAANLDGSCGRKVHEAVMGSLERP